MKLPIKTFTVLFAAATLYACNSGDNTSNTSTGSDTIGSDRPAAMDTSSNAMHSGADSAGASASASSASPEQDFLNFIVPANMKELAWLKAGMAKGMAKDIKSHSAMMLKDHTKMGADVKAFLAKKPTFTTPSVDTTNEVTINDKTGGDWDKAWADKMVQDHNDVLDRLKKAQNDVTDADLKKIITGAIPVIQSHLTMSKSIQEKLK